jgi:hypothetical protein
MSLSAKFFLSHMVLPGIYVGFSSSIEMSIPSGIILWPALHEFLVLLLLED